MTLCPLPTPPPLRKGGDIEVLVNASRSSQLRIAAYRRAYCLGSPISPCFSLRSFLLFLCDLCVEDFGCCHLYPTSQDTPYATDHPPTAHHACRAMQPGQSRVRIPDRRTAALPPRVAQRAKSQCHPRDESARCARRSDQPLQGRAPSKARPASAASAHKPVRVRSPPS